MTFNASEESQTYEQIGGSQNFTDDGNAVYRVRQYVWTIVAPIILIFGIFGNSMIILVFLCPYQRRRKPILSLTLVMLAVFDIMALLTGLTRHWLRKSVIQVDVQSFTGSNFVCKTHEFFVYFSLTMATWTLVVISVERFTIVWFRVRANVLLSVKKMSLIFAILLTLTLFLHGHFFWTRGIKSIGQRCESMPPYKVFSSNIMPVIDITMSTGIPMTLVFVLNISILYKLYLRLAENSRLTSQNCRKKYSRVMNSTTKMLLIVMLLFIICVLPTKIYIAVLPCKAPSYVCENKETTNKVTYQKFRLVWTAVLLLQYSNHAINFFVYVGTSSSFRNDLKRTFFTWMCRHCCPDRLIAFTDSEKNTEAGEYRRNSNVLAYTLNLRTGDTYMHGTRASSVSVYQRSPSPSVFR